MRMSSLSCGCGYKTFQVNESRLTTSSLKLIAIGQNLTQIILLFLSHFRKCKARVKTSEMLAAKCQTGEMFIIFLTHQTEKAL